LLVGPLGSGKTTFVKGLAEGLGFRRAASAVSSPSFVLMKEYPSRPPLFHADLYRLEEPGPEDEAMLRDYLLRDGVMAVEWADRALEIFPRKHLRICFDYLGESRREITLFPSGGFGTQRTALRPKTRRKTGRKAGYGG